METSIVYDENVRPIDTIEFNILGNNELLDISALGKDSIGIDVPDLYDNSEAKKNGLIDTRLGPSNPSVECATCGFDTTYCVGHFGHISLAEPVFNMGYIQYVKKILSCVCLKCSKLLTYKNEAELIDMLKNKTKRARFAEIRNIAKTVTYCQKPGYGCGTPVSKIKLEIKKNTCAINIVSESIIPGDEAEGDKATKKKLKQILTPEICYDILYNISDIDCMIMGIDPKKSKPDMMIYTAFPVPPVAVRPSAKVDFLESSTKEDDLTHKLADIIKANTRIRRLKESANEASSKYNQDHLQLLQYHVATYLDNESLCLPKAEQRNKASKSLMSRLKGKEGQPASLGPQEVAAY